MMVAMALAGAALGLCVGSFIVTIERRWPGDPKGLIVGRSCCPHCKTTLEPHDLVPILSWLWLRGRCRYCGAVLSWVYPVGEFAAGIIGAISFLLLPLPAAIVTAGFGWILLLIALIDFDRMVIPDSLNVMLLAVGLAASITQTWPILALRGPEPIDALMGVVGGFAVLWAINLGYRQLRGRDGLGLGDAKLLGAAGAWNGSMLLPEICMIAALTTLGAVVLTGGHKNRFRAVPFGPGLALAIWAVFLIQQVA